MTTPRTPDLATTYTLGSNISPGGGDLNNQRSRQGIAWQDSDPFFNTGRPPLNENNTNQSAQSPGQDRHVLNTTTVRQSESNGQSTDSDDIEKKESEEDDHHGMRKKLKTVGGKAKSKMHLESVKASGPSKLFNPTNVHMRVQWRNDHDGSDPSAKDRNKEMALIWRSRDNRKGRNSIAVPAADPNDPSSDSPQPTNRIKPILLNTWKMFTTFPYWDMAFWSGWGYTWGSVLFVIDGVWSWEPYAYGDKVESESLVTYGAPLCFFFGAILYQIGGVMAYLEAVNDGSFQGSAMRRFMEGREEDQKKMLDEKLGRFFRHFKPYHRHDKDEEAADALHDAVDPWDGWQSRDNTMSRRGSVYAAGKAPAPRRGGVDHGETADNDEHFNSDVTWRWWPTYKALKEHHVYEIGYIANAIQLLAVTLYGVTGIVVLPGILDSLKPWQTLAAFWIPQIVASVGFLVAGFLFMFETQETWWKPQLNVLGWHVGFWAMVGSWGFLLCAIFGIPGLYGGKHESHWAYYQSDLSSLWGSAAYLISSLIQWYEAINKNPVEEMLREPGNMKSYQIHGI